MNKEKAIKKRGIIFFVVNVDWFFLSHRLPVALAALNEGYDVTIVSKDTGHKDEILSYGLEFIDIPFKRSGSSPFCELKCIYKLSVLYKKKKPNIIHHVTLKASLLGCIAAKIAKERNVINAISGFGYNFTEERNGLRQKIIKYIMKIAFKCDYFHYILQNPDDIKQISDFKFTKNNHIHLIKGSGVDLNKFIYSEEILKDKIQILLLARMLYDKGIIEFIEAANKMKERVKSIAEFLLAGNCDTDNLSGISEQELIQLTDGKYIKWIGFQIDIFSLLKKVDIVVLPSYREGLPKSLIEACAVGRPIVTTDTQGCRECVIEGYNGYLVPVKDSDILTEKIEMLINDARKRKQMGLNSRELAEKEFSIDSVVKNHLKIYNMIIER